jgi:hypothetical protein
VVDLLEQSAERHIGRGCHGEWDSNVVYPALLAATATNGKQFPFRGKMLGVYIKVIVSTQPVAHDGVCWLDKPCGRRVKNLLNDGNE